MLHFFNPPRYLSYLGWTKARQRAVQSVLEVIKNTRDCACLFAVLRYDVVMQCTQRKATLGTYRKIAALIPSGAKVLDYGAGYCHGAELLRADSYEPAARCGVEPTFRTPQDVPDEAYDVVVCNCVSNVLHTRELRHAVLSGIVRALKPGGTAYVMVRSRSDVATIKHATEEGDGLRLENGAFQRGFTQAELHEIVSPFGETERITEVSNIGIRLTIPD